MNLGLLPFPLFPTDDVYRRRILWFVFVFKGMLKNILITIRIQKRSQSVKIAKYF